MRSLRRRPRLHPAPADREADATRLKGRCAAPKPYLYVEELAALVPWTVDAIRTKVRRGEVLHGVHYFQDGRRARLIFKWDAIVAFIEGVPSPTAGTAPGL